MVERPATAPAAAAAAGGGGPMRTTADAKATGVDIMLDGIRTELIAHGGRGIVALGRVWPAPCVCVGVCLCLCLCVFVCVCVCLCVCL